MRISFIALAILAGEDVAFTSGHFSPIEEPERSTTTVFDFLGAGDTGR